MTSWPLHDYDSLDTSACCLLCLVKLSQRISSVNTRKCQDEVTTWHISKGHRSLQARAYWHCCRASCMGRFSAADQPGTSNWWKIECPRGSNMCVMNKHSWVRLWTDRKVPFYPCAYTKITKSSHFQYSSIFSTETVVQMVAGGADQLSHHSQNIPPFDWFSCHPVCLWH